MLRPRGRPVSTGGGRGGGKGGVGRQRSTPQLTHFCTPASRITRLHPPPSPRSRLDEQQQPAADHSADARALSARVNARLASLWASSAPQPPSSPPDDEDDAPTPTDAERVEALRAGEEAARRLGSFGASAGDLPDLPRHADDFLLWTTTPLLAPWPSWMHHEQLGDIVR